MSAQAPLRDDLYNDFDDDLLLAGAGAQVATYGYPNAGCVGRTMADWGACVGIDPAPPAPPSKKPPLRKHSTGARAPPRWLLAPCGCNRCRLSCCTQLRKWSSRMTCDVCVCVCVCVCVGVVCISVVLLGG